MHDPSKTKFTALIGPGPGEGTAKVGNNMEVNASLERSRELTTLI